MLGLVGKINEWYLRETNFLLPHHRLFIKYLGSLSIIWVLYQLFASNRTWAMFDKF